MSLIAEPGWWGTTVDSDLEPEHAQFADPFPDDTPLPTASDGLAWTDADSLPESGVSMSAIVPIEPLSVLLDENQQAAPTAAEQARDGLGLRLLTRAEPGVLVRLPTTLSRASIALSS